MTKEEVIKAIKEKIEQADLMIDEYQAAGLPTVTAETHLLRAKKALQSTLNNMEFDNLSEAELQSIYNDIITIGSRFNHN